MRCRSKVFPINVSIISNIVCVSSRAFRQRQEPTKIQIEQHHCYLVSFKRKHVSLLFITIAVALLFMFEWTVGAGGFRVSIPIYMSGLVLGTHIVWLHHVLSLGQDQWLTLTIHRLLNKEGEFDITRPRSLLMCTKSKQGVWARVGQNHDFWGKHFKK